MWPFKRELWERGFCQTTESSTRRPLPWHRGSSFQKNSQNLKMFFNEKQPEPQNIFQWKTARISKCFSMKNNQNLKMFLNEKQQSSNSLSTFECERSAKAELTFFSKVRNVYLNLPPDGKLSSLELSGEVCEQIAQMLKIIRHKGLTIYFWVLLKSGQVDLLKRLLVYKCHRHFKCIQSQSISKRGFPNVIWLYDYQPKANLQPSFKTESHWAIYHLKKCPLSQEQLLSRSNLK